MAIHWKHLNNYVYPSDMLYKNCHGTVDCMTPT